ncbi:hypothetical protein Agub_g8776 [Astrephomene gubernaculifera]|uniref:sn-1-specific diacylglycerol lipase n=1 Tax=Astrephomene gubernaculifera TaxID=47775 RepID=A0AAD3DU80_9CHLO|nr:hypothetical protein Agub_g8776 [Astrephomene gubernaculifera]
MPALVVLNRKWHIATDDLPLPSIMGAVWHGVLLCAIAVDLAFVVRQLDNSCYYRERHIVYLSIHIACVCVNCLLHTWTFFESIRGSIFQPNRRSRVGPLAVAVSLCYALTIGNNAYGTRLIYQQARQPECPAVQGPLHLNHNRLLMFIVVANWVSLFIGCLAVFITLNLFSTYKTASTWLRSLSQLCRTATSRCSGCCGTTPPYIVAVFQGLCCGWGVSAVAGKGDGAEEEEAEEESARAMAKNMSPMVVIANVIQHVFGGVDMTLTDYLAAFALVGARHRHAKPACTYSNAAPPDWLQQQGADYASHQETHLTATSASTAPVTPNSQPNGVVAATPTAAQAMLRPPLIVEIVAATNGTSSAVNGGAAAGGGVSPAGRAVSRAGGSGSSALQPSEEGGSGLSYTAHPNASPAGAAAAASCNGTSSLPTDTLHRANGEESNPGGAYRTRASSDGAAVPTTSAIATTADADATDAATIAAQLPEMNGGMPGNINPDPKRPAGSVIPAMTTATSSVFGQAVLPDGTLPVLLHPRREWDGESRWTPNASLEVMEEAVHYMRFATAVYGWKLYFWMNRLQVTNCCLLCVGRGCNCCQRCASCGLLGPEDAGPSEGCCSPAKLMDREAITRFTGIADSDILYVSYKNKIGGLLPYYIAVDRSRRSLVVSIRGSLSFRDVVTDLLCEPTEYDVPGVASTDAQGRRVMWAHAGILRCTRAILADIQQQGVLAAALTEWPGELEARERLLAGLPSERARAVAAALQGECAGWRLVVTGHSLGAGVTGLLGPLLQADFPNLRCWAFAPPGGLMSPKAAELTRHYCVGVVHAKDMIPRLGVVTVERLVQELVTAGVHCRLTKAAIMARLVLLGRQPRQEELFEPFEQLSEEQREALRAYSDLKAYSVGSRYDNARDFVPPGRLLYLERHKAGEDEGPPCCSCNVCLLDRSSPGATFNCRWIEVDDLMAGGLVISRSMFLDHVPDNALLAMEQALQQMRAEHAQGPKAPASYPLPPPSPPRSSAAPVAAGSASQPPAFQFPPEGPLRQKPPKFPVKLLTYCPLQGAVTC